MTTHHSKPDTVLFAATHRSGSYLACDWLAQYAHLPFAEEYLNDNLLSARLKLQLSIDQPEPFVFRKLVETMRTNHGVFAVKAMWPAFASFFWRWANSIDPQRKEFGNLALHEMGAVKILFIRRQDKIRQAVSFEKARQTGVWRSPSHADGETEPTDLLYSYERILECLHQVESDERAWLDFFQRYNLPYQEIWYETMVADPQKILSEATAFLGIPKREPEVPIHSRFRKLSDSVNGEWTRRFKARYTSPCANLREAASGPVETCECALEWETSAPVPLGTDRATVTQLRLRHKSGPRLDPGVDSEYRGLWRVDFFVTSEPDQDAPPAALEKIWTASLDHPVEAGDEALIEVRLPGLHRLKKHQLFARLVVPPENVLAQSPAKKIAVKSEDSLTFFEAVFATVEESPWTDWIQLPKLGAVMVKSFPYIYHHQHGWWMIDVEKSRPGVLRIVDFELGHGILYQEHPKVFHILDAERGTRKLRFLGVEAGRRQFLDMSTNTTVHYRASASGEQTADTGNHTTDPHSLELNAILAKFEKNAGQRSAFAMNTPAERAYVQWAAQDYYQGSGCIVELGCWLGSLTNYLCAGLTANPHVAEKKPVYVYDRFQWTSIMNDYLATTEHSERYGEGDDYSDFFTERMGTHADLLHVTKGDLLQQDWSGQPIEVLLVDVMKSPALTAAVYRNFFPFLIPGKALILHQDYLTFAHPWIHILTYLLRDSLELKHIIPHSGMVSFTATDSFDPELEVPDTNDAITAHLIQRAYEWNFQLFPEQHHACLAAAAIHLHLQRSDLSSAEKLCQRYRSVLPEEPAYQHMVKFNRRFLKSGNLTFLVDAAEG